MKNIEIIEYVAACKNCRTQNKFSLTLMRDEDEEEPLSRSELLNIMEPDRMVCINCRRKGNMRILFFIVNNIIYDMEYPPTIGYITLDVKKRNNEIISGELFPSINGFGLYDCLNCLTVIQEEIGVTHDNWMSNENRSPTEFQSLSDGDFSFPVNLVDEPPYISIKGYQSRGFSYEELIDIIHKLRKPITDNLTENNRLY